MSEWKYFQIDHKSYFNKLNNNETKFIYLLTNFEILWTEELNLADLLQRAKNHNPIIDPGLEKITNSLKNDTPKKYTLNVDETQDNSNLTLNLKYYISGVPFNFYWKLIRCPSKQFFELITKSLMGQCMKNRLEIDYLKNLIKNKDSEIQQYILEGAVLQRKFVQTVRFSETDYNSKIKTESVDLSIGVLLGDESVRRILEKKYEFSISLKEDTSNVNINLKKGSNRTSPPKPTLCSRPSKSKIFNKFPLANKRLKRPTEKSVVYERDSQESEDDNPHKEEISKDLVIGDQTMDNDEELKTRPPKIRRNINL